MTKKNAMAEMISDVKGIWLRRGGKTPEAVMDTIDAIYKDLKPHIFKRIQHDTGWEFLVTLPPGMCYADIKGKQQPAHD